jgi:hypothetical protein
MEIRERVLTHGASLPTRAGSSSKKKNNKKKKNANKNKAAEQPVSGSSDLQQGSDKETLEDEPETPTQPVRSYDAHPPYLSYNCARADMYQLHRKLKSMQMQTQT